MKVGELVDLLGKYPRSMEIVGTVDGCDGEYPLDICVFTTHTNARGANEWREEEDEDAVKVVAIMVTS